MPFIGDAAPRWASTPIRLSARKFCAMRAAFLVELTSSGVAQPSLRASEVSDRWAFGPVKRPGCIAPWGRRSKNGRRPVSAWHGSRAYTHYVHVGGPLRGRLESI